MNEKKQIIPRGHYVLIRQEFNDELKIKNNKSIKVIRDEPTKRYPKIFVEAIGHEVTHVDVGAEIVISTSAMLTSYLGDQDMMLMHQTDILGTVEDIKVDLSNMVTKLADGVKINGSGGTGSFGPVKPEVEFSEKEKARLKARMVLEDKKLAELLEEPDGMSKAKRDAVESLNFGDGNRPK